MCLSVIHAAIRRYNFVAILMGFSLLLVVSANSQAAGKLKFAIKTIELEGNTLLSADKIRPVLFGYVGADKQFSDLRSLVSDVELLYRNAGYPTVKALLPPQSLSSGHVRVEVVEFKLGYVEVSEGTYFSADNLRDSVPQLRSGVIPNNNDLAQAIERANQHPAKRLQVIFKPGREAKTIDAELLLEERSPFDFRLGYNNEGTEFSGENQLSLAGRYTNILGLDHELGVQLIGSPIDNQEYLAGLVTYNIPFYLVGGKLTVFGYRSEIDDVEFNGDFSVAGLGSSYGLRYNQDFSNNASLKHRVSIGAAYKTYGSTIRFHGAIADEVPEFHSAPISLGYSVLYRPVNQTWYSLLGFNLAWNTGLTDAEDADFAQARSGAQADFWSLNAKFTLSTEIVADWRFRMHVAGQYADEPMIPTEQFGVGGSESLRGLSARQLIDDRGVSTNLEVYTPNFGRVWFGEQTELRGLVFSDLAQLSRVNERGDTVNDREFYSYGVGIRLRIDKMLSVQVDHAWLGDESLPAGSDDSRLHVGLSWLWHP